MPNILLLRTPDAPKDRYEEAFISANRRYYPLSVGVLETVLTNISSLGSIIYNGLDKERLDGVLITSKRSCEAWAEAIKELEKLQSDSILVQTVKEAWTKVPFYVVGEATASGLREVFGSTIPVDIRGQGSGNAAALGPFILEEIAKGPLLERRHRLLYLTGDKNRDTLSTILVDGQVELEEIQVYKTEGSTSFESDLRAALSTAESNQPPEADWWIVHFAPSAASLVAPVLRKYFTVFQEAATTAGRGGHDLRFASIAAIGPTTDAALSHDLGFHVDVVSPKPTPESVVQAIAQFEEQRALHRKT